MWSHTGLGKIEVSNIEHLRIGSGQGDALRSLAFAFVFVLSVVCGAIVARTLGCRSSEGRPPMLRSSTPPPASDSRPAEPARTESEPEDVAHDRDIPAEDLGELLGTFPSKEYERGDGVITGIVCTLDDEPVPDVDVSAIIWGATPGPDPKPIQDATLLEYILQEIDQFHYDKAMIHTVRTAAD
ncbi:MAG: hypothetical protein KDC38_01990, partial [Planctomycetes bacterium]|nr:hypothetical protein [Planctomycetota bacterium]